MRNRATLVPAAALLLAGWCAGWGPALLAGEDVPLGRWGAPPYWSLEPAAPADGERLEARDVPSLDALPSQPLPFVAINPCRLADTRDGTFPGPLGPPALSAGVARDFPVTGYCGIPTTAQAVSFNVTVTNTLGPGFILVYPTGGSAPTVSTVNYVVGQTIANAAVVPLGTDGKATFVAGVSGTDLILDVNGYYAPQPVVNSVSGLSGALTLSGSANIAVTPAGSTLSLGLTGPAGGSLAGTYPFPTIAARAVGAAQIEAGSVDGSHVADGSLQAADVAAGQVVKSLNSFRDAVTIQGGGGVTVTSASNAVTIAAPAGSMILGNPGDATLTGQGYTEIGPSSIEYWKPTSRAGVENRMHHCTVWTGTRMMVWGGTNENGWRNDGEIYDPATDTWLNMRLTNAPTARGGHTAVWTGSVMVVWGGYDGSNQVSTGGVYDPAGLGSWTATATAGAPTARDAHTAVWTGSRMVVWGGRAGASEFNTGGRYDPTSNTWSATTTTGAPTARSYHSAVWTGSRVVVWGGDDGPSVVNTGGRYDPTSNVWSTVTTTNAPTARLSHSAVWTGTEMIVWGGTSATTLATGGRYNPSTDVWTSMTTTAAPPARDAHPAVWTGSAMIVWGGLDVSDVPLSGGGIYNPTTDSWSTPTSTSAPAARWSHSLVWIGSRLIVWGGSLQDVFTAGTTNTGAIWSQLSIYSKS